MKTQWLLLALLAPLTALAQEALEPIPPTTGGLWPLFVQYLVVPMFIGLAGLITLGLRKLGAYLDAKTADATASATQKAVGMVGAKVAHFGEVVVHDLEATLKPELQKRVADGVLTAAEAKELRAIALARVKELLTEKGLAELQAVLGLAPAAVDRYLEGVVETAVARMAPIPVTVGPVAPVPS